MTVYWATAVPTEDTTSSITVTEQDMCGGTCNANMYFGIAGKDSVGNVADPGADMYADMTAGLDAVSYTHLRAHETLR